MVVADSGPGWAESEAAINAVIPSEARNLPETTASHRLPITAIREQEYRIVRL